MTESIAPVDRLVDYLDGANAFMRLMKITVPDMRWRGKTAEWVLTHYQSRRNYGRRSYSVNSPFYAPRRSPQVVPIDFRPVQELEIFKRTIYQMQQLHRDLHGIPGIPSTQLGRILLVLTRHPVITVAQMSEGAQVSEATAKRWLKAMPKRLIYMKEKPARGVNVYVNHSLIELIDSFR